MYCSSCNLCLRKVQRNKKGKIDVYIRSDSRMSKLGREGSKLRQDV